MITRMIHASIGTNYPSALVALSALALATTRDCSRQGYAQISPGG
jgi:hypothetical protein